MEKRFRLLIVLLALLSNLCCHKDKPSEKLNIDKGLTFYFPFSGNSVEQVSQASFNIHGATYGEDRLGKASSALVFNGSNYMDLRVEVANDQGSLSFWINANSLDPYPIFYSGPPYSSPIPTEYDIAIGGGGFSTYYVLKWFYETQNVIEAGKWYHFVIRWDHQNRKLDMFINNKKTLSQDYNRNEDGPGYPKGAAVHLGKGYKRGIGNHDPYSETYFKGKMDEIRSYSRWITDKEVEKLFSL